MSLFYKVVLINSGYSHLSPLATTSPGNCPLLSAVMRHLWCDAFCNDFVHLRWGWDAVLLKCGSKIIDRLLLGSGEKKFSAVYLQVCVLSHVRLCDPMDCSNPGSSVHGISQERILEWVAIPFSRRFSQPGDRTQVSCFEGRFFTIWATREWVAISYSRGSPQPRDQTQISYISWIGRQILYHCATHH